MVGWVTLRSLLLAPPEAPLASIMQEHPAPVLSDDSPALVADLAAKYDLYSLPVESADGRLLGVITVDDILIRVLRG
jgi:magnesium transporter